MKKYFLLFVLIPILCGCSITKDKVERKWKWNSLYSTCCDKEYGVEYIIYMNGNNGGITVRLDEDGKVIRCKEDK